VVKILLHWFDPKVNVCGTYHCDLLLSRYSVDAYYARYTGLSSKFKTTGYASFQTFVFHKVLWRHF